MRIFSSRDVALPRLPSSSGCVTSRSRTDHGAVGNHVGKRCAVSFRSKASPPLRLLAAASLKTCHLGSDDFRNSNETERRTTTAGRSARADAERFDVRGNFAWVRRSPVRPARWAEKSARPDGGRRSCLAAKPPCGTKSASASRSRRCARCESEMDSDCPSRRLLAPAEEAVFFAP